MDSEDSHDGSSGNESSDDGCQSPNSVKSPAARSPKLRATTHSRSSSSESQAQSAMSHLQEESPQSPVHHSTGDGHYSEDDSNHSEDSQHSQDNKCSLRDDIKGCSSPGSNSPMVNENVLSQSPNHTMDDQRFNNSSFQDFQEMKSNKPSLNRDTSPDSPHSSVSSTGNKSPIDRQISETKKGRSYGKSPENHIRSRSRSFSSSSDDNDENFKSSEVQKAPEKKSVFNFQGNTHSYSQEVQSTKERQTSVEQMSDDNESIKSASSSISKSSRASQKSASSEDSHSGGSRNSRSTRSRKKSNSSVSSSSSRGSNHKKNIIKSPDTHAEEISDGDMESEQEIEEQHFKESTKSNINIVHEDLSDVSDLEESLGGNLDADDKMTENESKRGDVITENNNSPDNKQIAKNKGTEEGEEQLDFEAEDGECGELEQSKDEAEERTCAPDEDLHEEPKESKELEEGEVTDEDDVRPEETEPRPVCRFFSRGQCTWGASCRFLHPGVTDKGNYTMFELIRPVVPGEFGRDERMYGKPEPPLIESAWERGLRTAKEMLRKSVKRKEQDIDFEEKKMNLSLAQEEFDKDNGYYGRVPSPEPRYVRHIPPEYSMPRQPPTEEYYSRRQMVYEPEYPPLPARERVRTYRELPAHRIPDYYNKYEEEPPASKRPKPKREVIVQRVDERQGRGDEWSDPWMRSKSPAGRRKENRKRSYSSGSSYSSSSSSRSSSDSSRSTYRSRSRSSHHRREPRSHRSRQVSPSVIVSERKAANERAALMNPPAPKRRAPSPGMMRVTGAANPPAPSRDDLRRSRSKLAAALARVKAKRTSRSSSASSGSSSSDSDSSDSSSSTSRDESSPRRPPGVELSIAKAMDALKSGGLEKTKIKLNLKNPVGMKKNEITDSRKVEQSQGKKRTAVSPPAGDPKSKKATSRREELLKQLKAVEDAIAKKRSKVI